MLSPGVRVDDDDGGGGGGDGDGGGGDGGDGGDDGVLVVFLFPLQRQHHRVRPVMLKVNLHQL